MQNVENPESRLYQGFFEMKNRFLPLENSLVKCGKESGFRPVKKIGCGKGKLCGKLFRHFPYFYNFVKSLPFYAFSGKVCICRGFADFL